MMLKVGSEYLDFDGSVEVERKIKLFEDLSTSDGDVSFQFEVQNTNHNARLLTYPVPDSSSKRTYQKIECDLQDNSGVSLYTGFLRIERKAGNAIALSFFSGNSNWFGMIAGNLRDLDFSAYDVENTIANITASWTQSEGLIFPLIDHGGLLTRSYPEVKIEDFIGCFYVKTIFKRIFAQAGIKLRGELFQDWRFQNMICAATSKDQAEIDARSSYVLKDTNQVIAYDTETLIEWDDDSTYPYFDGDEDNFDLTNNKYVADIRMSVKVEVTFTWHTTGAGPFGVLLIYVNGVAVRFRSTGGSSDTEIVCSFAFNWTLDAGDEMEFRFIQVNADTDAATLLGGTVKITPTFIYKTNGNAAVPNWTSQQFVSNILRIFNVLPSYEPTTATLTLNLFEKLKEKEPADLSQYITNVEVDYEEFISDYARKSIFSYNKVEFEEMKQYNQGKFLKYSQGVIEINNDFLQETDTVLESDFSNPLGYTNAVFDASLERTNLIEMEEGEEVEFDDVADDGSGNAAFHINNEIFVVGDLVRIKDATNTVYNGDWIVAAIPSAHVVLTGVPFDTAASGKVVKINYKHTNDDEVYLFLNIPNYQISKFSDTTMYMDDATASPDALTSISYAYFDLIDTGRTVNDEYKQSLAFGSPDDALRYQRTMLNDYWGQVERTLNDPVKLPCTALMPTNVYRSLDFLRPISLKTLDSSNKYYLNKMEGYESASQEFLIELIKLP